MSKSRDTARFVSGLPGDSSSNVSSNNNKTDNSICDINQRVFERPHLTYSSSKSDHIYEDSESSLSFVLSDVRKEDNRRSNPETARLFGQSRSSLDLLNSLDQSALTTFDCDIGGKENSQVFRSEINIQFSPSNEELDILSNRAISRQTNLPKTMNIKFKQNDGHSNLIDFSTPPNSPFRIKNNIQETKQTFQYPATDPVSRKEVNFSSDSLVEEFSLLASDLQDTLESGSLVEIVSNSSPLYGVIRCSGKTDSKLQPNLVGIELEEEIEDGTDGSYLGRQYFHCPPGRGVFVPLRFCKKDSRFDSSSVSHLHSIASTLDIGHNSEMDYGGPDCPPVVGAVAPISQTSDIEKLSGKFRGIQGHHNSCYLDATLFSMFTFTSVFDCLLYRPPTREDIPQYDEVQRILREDIVNPLRQNCYVRSDKVMKLRRLLQKLGSVTGLTNEEKDPEEFLHCLLSQTLRAEPFLKLSSGQEAYHHQLFVEKDEKLLMPTVQQLFEQSFLSSDIKLKEVPPCLIIQMPRFGKSYKMYPHVLPSSLLDITDVLENSPRQCIVCGRLAEMECQQCLGHCGSGLESIAFCSACLTKVHSHSKRTTHQAQPLKVPPEFAELREHCIIPRLYMELFAVVCIATSHYVTFVKCGPGPDAPWCFFDSMADRKGEQNGYNIPEVVPCPDLPHWLSDDWDKHALLSGEPSSSSTIPEHARRLFSDAYMCLYQSPDLMLYR
nr:EOG090X03LH [Sida crystallina]